eukprot:Platyproteum_vivax@DN6500_c0_g1_i2.p1
MRGGAAENAMLLSNHNAFQDWAYILAASEKLRSAGFLRLTSKVEALKYVPWGPVMYMSGFIFFSRNWTQDSATIERDLPKQFAALQTPFIMHLYPEGTRITPKKKAQADAFAKERGLKPLENLLQPRYKGFVSIMQSLGDRFDAVYDITMGYGQGNHPPSIKNFCVGDHPTGKVHIHIKRIPIAEVPKDRAGQQQWLFDRWQTKDALLKNHALTGQFNAKPLPKDTVLGLFSANLHSSLNAMNSRYLQTRSGSPEVVQKTTEGSSVGKEKAIAKETETQMRDLEKESRMEEEKMQAKLREEKEEAARRETETLLQADKLDAERQETERRESEKQQEEKKQEAERLEAARLQAESERLQAEKQEEEKKQEAERLVERKETERLMAEKQETERQEAEKQRQEAETQKVEREETQISPKEFEPLDVQEEVKQIVEQERLQSLETQERQKELDAQRVKEAEADAKLKAAEEKLAVVRLEGSEKHSRLDKELSTKEAALKAQQAAEAELRAEADADSEAEASASQTSSRRGSGSVTGELPKKKEKRKQKEIN